MRRIATWTAIASVAAGCQQAPVTKPRILSVQTPAGMPPAASLSTTRNTPLIVPTAPVGQRQTVVAPAVAVPVVTPIAAPPPGVIAAPVPPPGAQGVLTPNTIAQPPQYPPPAGAVVVPGATSLKEPEKLPGPVSSSTEEKKPEDR